MFCLLDNEGVTYKNEPKTRGSEAELMASTSTSSIKGLKLGVMGEPMAAP